MNRTLLVFLSASNVLLSAGLQIVPLIFFGASSTVDAFVAGMMAPSVIAAISAVVITYSLVPQLTGISMDAQGAIVRRSFVAVTGILGAPTVALIIAAPAWVPWTVPGFPAEQIPVTIELARISLAASLVGIYALVLSARLQSNSEFVLNALTAVFGAGVASLFAVVAIGQFGIVAAAWSLVLKSLLQFGLTWALRPPALGRRSGPTIVFGRRAGPLLASTSICKLEPLVDRSLLTMAPPGVLTLFYLAQQIYGALSQVVAGSLLAHVLPRLSYQALQGVGGASWEMLRRELHRAAWIAVAVGLMLGGAFVAAALLVEPLCATCSVVLGRLELGRLAQFVVALGGVWFFGLQGSVLSSFFYAQGDTTTPSVVAVVGFVAAIGLKIGGFAIGGALGLAVATSLYFFSTAAAMYVLARRRCSEVQRG